jgi:hypothetical protein
LDAVIILTLKIRDGKLIEVEELTQAPQTVFELSFKP